MYLWRPTCLANTEFIIENFIIAIQETKKKKINGQNSVKSKLRAWLLLIYKKDTKSTNKFYNIEKQTNHDQTLQISANQSEVWKY